MSATINFLSSLFENFHLCTITFCFHRYKEVYVLRDACIIDGDFSIPRLWKFKEEYLKEMQSASTRLVQPTVPVSQGSTNTSKE